MFSQLVDSDVFADVDACLELYAEFTQNVDFRFDDVFFEFVGRNTVCKHTTEFFVLFEHGWFVTLRCKIVCARKSRRACADDCYLLRPLFVNVGRNDDFGDESRFRVQILLCDKLLDCVDGHCLVNRSSGAGCLATLVADTTADCGERIVLLDEFESLSVLALFCFADITLNCDVRRASRFARRFVAVDTVVIPVILIPLVRTPTEVVGKFVLGIFDFALLGAKFLTEFDRA